MSVLGHCITRVHISLCDVGLQIRTVNSQKLSLVDNVRVQYLFQALGGISRPSPQTYDPPDRLPCTLCALNVFYRLGQRVTQKLIYHYHGNVLLINDTHRKLFVVISNQTGENLCLKGTLEGAYF